MDIELLVVEGCPHEGAAAVLLRRALDDIGLSRTAFATVVVSDLKQAEARSFVGSPSFFSEGRDLLPQPEAAPALACRVYRTRSGPAALPDIDALRKALKESADRLRREAAASR